MDREIRRAGRIIAFLSREQVDFLDRIAKDALFTTGHKLSRTQIISSFVDVMQEMAVDGKDIVSTEGFKAKIMKKLARGAGSTDEHLVENINQLSEYHLPGSQQEAVNKDKFKE